MEKNKNYDDNNFENKEYIASGAYGDIFSAYSKKDRLYLCLKCINLNKMKSEYQKNKFNKSYQDDLDNEIAILQLFSHYSNSLKYYGSYDKENEKIIVLEKCDENLEAYMNNRNKALSTEKIKEIFTGLNEVFKAMYENKIIHRDLKLSNILLKYKDSNKENIIIKLGDYGLGKFLNKSKSITGLKGSPETAAPEILLEKISNYENSVDMFSLGVILYQLSHNLKHPFNNNHIERILIYSNKYDEDDFNILFDNSIENPDFKDLLKKMLKLNPKNRLTWEKYFSHPFFK